MHRPRRRPVGVAIVTATAKRPGDQARIPLHHRMNSSSLYAPPARSWARISAYRVVPPVAGAEHTVIGAAVNAVEEEGILGGRLGLCRFLANINKSAMSGNIRPPGFARAGRSTSRRSCLVRTSFRQNHLLKGQAQLCTIQKTSMEASSATMGRE